MMLSLTNSEVLVYFLGLAGNEQESFLRDLVVCYVRHFAIVIAVAQILDSLVQPCLVHFSKIPALKYRVHKFSSIRDLDLAA